MTNNPQIWKEAIEYCERDLPSALEEGCALDRYKDRGEWAIGPGCRWREGMLLKMTRDQVMTFFNQRLEIAVQDCQKVFGDVRFDNAAQLAGVIKWCYVFGMNRMLKFKQFIGAIRARDWSAAHRELIDSRWYREQDPKRAALIAAQILTGIRPEI